MENIQDMSRAELERYTKELEQEKELLLEAMELAEDHGASSTETHSKILDRIQEVQRDTDSDSTRYDTTGVQGAIDKLKNTVEKTTERPSDTEQTDSK